MNYLTHQLLNPQEIKLLKESLFLKDLPWEDGKKTAGNHAAKVKDNLQLNKSSEISKKYTALIEKRILNNDLIKSFALPKRIHGTMFTKSLQGMRYGRHIDNAFMSTGRADLSFTIFLNNKDK
ncbi:Fe2+-dependent dioxygenase, partial [Prochlorococcus sp. AH-736-K20]